MSQSYEKKEVALSCIFNVINTAFLYSTSEAPEKHMTKFTSAKFQKLF